MTKTSITVKPLTPGIFKQFHGKLPEYSIKGYAWFDGDEVFAVCCVTQFRADTLLLFDNKKDLSGFRLKRVVVQGWPLVKTLFKGEVYSIVDDTKPTAVQLHKHLGFEPIEDELYVYRGA
jgi:hypothetical protein